MIKQLITELAHDQIRLGQALTRAKLIAAKIKNERFRHWLVKELEGYDADDAALPEYRKIYTRIFVKAQMPYGRTQTVQLTFPENFDEQALDLVNNHRATEPIAIVEELINSLTSEKGHIDLHPRQVQLFQNLYKDYLGDLNAILISGYREVGKVQYQNVLEMTKQKLLDTLIDLDAEFPNLENDFAMNKENKDAVNNIVNNHIYGDYNTTNVAAGRNVKQHNRTVLSKEDTAHLISLGILQEQISELETIIRDQPKNKPGLGKAILKWLGSVSASVAARGLAEHIPAITTFAHGLM